MKKPYFYLKIVILLLLLIWFAVLITHKINLSTVDLGRHLKNGELALQGDFSVLKKNFYSYTYPNYPVVNHHWGSGVLFFLIQKAFGFSGLHVFFIALNLLTFLILFSITQRRAGILFALPVSLLVIPLLSERYEIRPEVLSYFFAALFFYLLWRYRENRLKEKWLFALPVLIIFWVNTHIYFFFGPVFIAAFLLEQVIRTKKIKALGLILFLSILACFVNPYGAQGIIYPFAIWGNYGYRLIENQSIVFLEKLNIINNPNFLTFKIVFSLLVLSFILMLFKNWRRFSLINLFLATGFSVMAWLALRNLTIFGFFALPIIAINFKTAFPNKTRFNYSLKSLSLTALITFIFLTALFTNSQYYSAYKNGFGLGLVDGTSAAAHFFQEEKIAGPIFNNYDIGGYLIYHLYPHEKVFVDNRPEAYPASFFKETYIPLQEDQFFWQEERGDYNFNALFFYYHDATPWAQNFLVSRINDPEWVPVFVDQNNIIFLKNNEQNQNVIQEYEIPRENFSVRKN